MLTNTEQTRSPCLHVITACRSATLIGQSILCLCPSRHWLFPSTKVGVVSFIVTQQEESMGSQKNRVCRKLSTKVIHQCHYCPSTFASRNGMKRHETEIHQTPRKCPYCYRAIRRLTNLRGHVKDQHGTELESCVGMSHYTRRQTETDKMCSDG